jgi:hypothetical protein
MPNQSDPVMVELAPLPRNQIGPYLILGVDKDATKEAVEAGWAQRLIWARRNQFSIALEDINWARDTLNDDHRRLQAAAVGLNVDTVAGTLKRLRQEQESRTGCRPIDVEKNLADYNLEVAIPALDELRRSIVVPQLPSDVPAVSLLVAQMVGEPIAPWEI